MKLNNIPTLIFLLFPSLHLDIDNPEDIPVIFGILAHHTNENLPQSQNICLFFYRFSYTTEYHFIGIIFLQVTLSEYSSYYRNLNILTIQTG